MDSGNSGSLQSSSGGDDDFDPRCGADSSPLSALLRHPPSPPPAPGFGAGSLIYGLHQDLRTPPPSQSSHWCSTAPLPAAAGGPSPPPLGHDDGLLLAASAADHDQQQPPAQAAAPRGSRKRARASRRAPTTVLTTDTSNFRAMVQEFTGIPAPPFAAARSRFDHLFPSRSAGAAALPQYLLRPFANKLHPPPFATSPAPANVAIAPAPAAGPAATAAVAPPSDGYQQFATASPPALLGMQGHHSSSYLSNFQGTHGHGDAKYATDPGFFDRGMAAAASAPRPQDPGSFLGSLPYGIMGSEGMAAHLHLHPRNGSSSDRARGSGAGDELSGLVVGGASGGTVPAGCKATYSYSPTPPLLERNGRGPSAAASTATATTKQVAATAPPAAMRTQGLDSWVCTSD